MLNSNQLDNAISLNRYYARFLAWNEYGTRKIGWMERLPAILTLLNIGGLPTEHTFAMAVETWQAQQGVAQCDGVLGQRTWVSMEPRTRMCVNRTIVPGFFGADTFGIWPTPFQPTVAHSSMLIPGRGFMFIAVQVLPDVGERHLIRKVAVVPRNFALRPANPLGVLIPAEHALNLNPMNSQWLSASNRSYGAPSINGRPLLIDMQAVTRAGGRIVSEVELIADLERYAIQNPTMRISIQRLIGAIRGIEGETLIAGSPPYGAVRTISTTHNAYISRAEGLWARFTAHKISQAELEVGLSNLDDAYRGSRAIGRIGRVFMVAGVVLTVVDIGVATRRSVEKQTYRPLAAETVRQVGGWGGAVAGVKIGGISGAALGIETGPGAIVTGAIGAIIFGAAGYFGADWVADRIDEN